jgi:parallel beta-helix repeat protein
MLVCASVAHAGTSRLTAGERIGAVLTRLQPGDTIQLGPGIYDETLSGYEGLRWPSGSSGSQPITLVGVPGQTILRPSSGALAIVIMYAGYLVLQDLVIDGSNLTNTVVKLDLGSHHVRLQNIQIVGHRRSNGILMGGEGHAILGGESPGHGGYGIYNTGHHTLIDGACLHHHNGYGAHIYKSGSSEVSWNIIRNSVRFHKGWDNENPVGSCAMVLASGEGNVAENNTVSDHNGCGIQIYNNAINSRVTGNTVVGVTTVPILDAGRGTVIQNNRLDLPQGTQGLTTCGGGLFPGPKPSQPPPVLRNLRVVGVR